MASFTDQISQFNPYIQELPVEAMAQVGMVKQAQYDQGVQKVQNYIDRISGLEIIKPEHKKYLQSVMDELGSKLKTVAAGDFSNQQLVNSVSGMTGQIIKDPIVQNAVNSTAIVKKGYGDLETARKAGKSNKNNEDYYEKNVSDWMSNPDLKTSFQGRYTPYTDYKKKLIEVADGIKKNPSGTSVDQPFVRDDEGKTLYFKPIKNAKGKVIGESQSTDPSQGGQKRVDQLDMVRTKVKGVPARQLYDAFNTTLDANDLEQMKIDSWAKFRGADAKSFQDAIVNTYQGKKDMLSQQIVKLAVDLQDPKLTSAEKSEGNNMLKQMTKMKEDGVLDKQMNEELSTFNKKIEEQGVDNFKFNIYKEDYLTNLSRELSFKTFEEERLANPAAQAIIARQKFELDQWATFDASKRGWAGERRLQAKDDFEKYVKMQELTPTSLTDVTSGVIGTGKKVPTIESEREALVGLLGQKGELDSKWAKYLFPDLKEANDYSQALGELLNNYKKNPQMNLTANQKEYIREATALDDQTQEKLNVINYAMKQGEKKALDKAASAIGDVTLSNGTKFAAADVADVVSKLGEFKRSIYSPYSSRATGEYGVSGGGSFNTFNSEGAKNFFATYQGGKYAALVAPLIKQAEGKADVKDMADVTKINLAQGTYLKETESIPQYESDELLQISPSLLSQNATLDPDFSKADERNISRFLDKATGRYNALDKKPDWDVNKVNGWWATRKSGDEEAVKTGWNFEKFEDGTAQIVVSRGDEKEIIPVLPEDMGNYFPNSTQTSPFNSIKRVLRTSPNHTTNLAGSVDDDPTNGVNARYSGNNLPQLKGVTEADLFRYDIRESPNNSGRAGSDKYLFIGFVKDPKTDTWKRQELSNGYEGEGKMLQILNNWNKNNIYEAQKTWK